MALCFKYLIGFLLVTGIIARPKIDEDGELFTLEDETQMMPSLESRFTFEGEEPEAEHGFEDGTFFQGDIKLIQDQKEYLLANDSDDSTPTRTGWIDEHYRWPKDADGHVIFPYELSAKSAFTNYHKGYIKLAMDMLEKYTCVRFRPRSTEIDYVLIYAGSGCHSNMGRIGNKQEISLHKNGCFSKGTIMHEIIHALGYDHMHSSADRDDHVKIMYDNISPAAFSNFDRVNPKKFGNFGTEYDMYSVMHYNSKAFSKNGKDTIVPKNPRYAKVIGQRTGLSVNDVKRINNMYNCVV